MDDEYVYRNKFWERIGKKIEYCLALRDEYYSSNWSQRFDRFCIKKGIKKKKI